MFQSLAIFAGPVIAIGLAFVSIQSMGASRARLDRSKAPFVGRVSR